MRAILEVHTGVLAGNKIHLDPGRLLRIGRSRRADLALPDDAHMSGSHFVVECDATSCRLRDLKSSNGTLLNGKKVDAAVLQDGDRITAGHTDFVVRIVPDPAPAQAPVASPEAATLEERLLALLRDKFQPLYAILDAAREPSVLKVIVESKAEYQSLFEGPEGAQLAHFAPYLISLPPASPLLETLVREGWGKSWGIFLACPLPISQARAHFRALLTTKLPDDRQVYFRYYDPRVLRLFLPTCLPEEINLFFGPVKYYLMEDEKAENLLRFSNAGRGAGLRTYPLHPAAQT